MYVLVNKNTINKEYCEPFVIAVSKDQSKLEKLREKILEDNKNFSENHKKRQNLIEKYLRQQLKDCSEVIKKVHKSRKDDTQINCLASGKINFNGYWENFLQTIIFTLDKEQFNQCLIIYGFENIIKFPEHIGELKFTPVTNESEFSIVKVDYI